MEISISWTFVLNLHTFNTLSANMTMPLCSELVTAVHQLLSMTIPLCCYATDISALHTESQFVIYKVGFSGGGGGNISSAFIDDKVISVCGL